MVSDVDWLLLERRLESIERSIDMLKAMFPVKEGTLTASSGYALQEGNLMDAGLAQLWNQATINQIGKPMGISCPCPKCTPYSM